MHRRVTTYFFVIFTMILLTMVFMNPMPSSAQDDRDQFMEARMLVNSGRYLEAVAQYQGIADSSDRENTKARALFFIASIYDQYLDQPERALACFEDIVRLYPESQAAPDALFNSGSLHYKNDRYRQARKAFNAYVERYPDGMRRQSAMAWADSSADHIQASPVRPGSPSVLTALSPNLRVLLIKNKNTLTFSGSSGLVARDVDSGRILFASDGPFAVSLKKGQMLVNNRPTGVKACLISPVDTFLGMDGQRFRGQIHVLVKPSGLMAVNSLSIEDYLYGVVPKEMSWLWSSEALMAQAVASRTYALYIRDKQRLAGSDYDLEATTASQVYGGADAEKDQAVHAVNQTRGMVLTHQGKLIIAYFHANSGGTTESALNVWGVDIPYLKSVSDSFSTILPESIWEHRVTLKDLTFLFKHRLPDLGSIKRIEAGRKSQSGRILSFKLVSGKGQAILSGNVFRMTLGPTKLKSTLFDIYSDRETVTFKGEGYGHGVGMSQWGAHRMAQAGYSYDAILKHYYTGVSLMRVSYL